MSEFKHNDSVWVKGFIAATSEGKALVSLIKGPGPAIGQTIEFSEDAISHRTSDVKDPESKDYLDDWSAVRNKFKSKEKFHLSQMGPMPWRLQIAASLISEYGEIDALRIADDLIKRHEETK